MSKTQIAFFDIKDFDQDFLTTHKPDDCDYFFFKESIHQCPEEMLDSVKEVDVISVFTSSRVPADVLEKFSNLKLVTTRSTGFNHINLDYCKQNNIPVVNVPRYGDVTVAEFAFGLLLNVIRRIDIAYNDLKDGIINIQGYVGRDLYGKTIGIIGTGAIGCHSVRIAKGFGMRVIAFDPYPKKEYIEMFGVEYVNLDQLFKEADIISIHAPSTKENHHMINEASFEKMKRGVVIINTARGELMDTEALYRAIKNGIVSGAGLDVLECEDILMQSDAYMMKVDCINKDCLSRTLINHKLLELPNVIVTPHVAFDSQEAIQRILFTTVENIKAFLSGNIINKVN